MASASASRWSARCHRAFTRDRSAVKSEGPGKRQHVHHVKGTASGDLPDGDAAAADTEENKATARSG